MSWGVFLFCLACLLIWTAIQVGRALWVASYTRAVTDWGRTLAGAWIVFTIGWALLGALHLIG